MEEQQMETQVGRGTFLKNKEKGINQANLGEGQKNPSIDFNRPIDISSVKSPDPALLSKAKTRSDYISRIQESIDKVGLDAKANDAFIQGVAQAKYGRPATADELQAGGQFGLVGKPIRDVISAFGIEGQIKNFGLEAPQEATQATQKAEAPEKVSEPQKTTAQKIIDLTSNLGTLRQDVKTQAQQEVGLEEKSQAISEAQKVVNDLNTQLANQQIVDIKELKALEGQGRGIPLSIINAQQADLSEEQKLDLMITQNNYNNALVNLQIAQGSYDRASAIVKETADATFENARYQLEALKLSGQIEAQEADRYEQALSAERDLALQGYVEIPQTELEGVIQEVGRQGIFTDPLTGKNYIRPAEETKLNTQVVTAGGRQLLIDKNTGDIIKDLGGAYKTASGVTTGNEEKDADIAFYTNEMINQNPSLVKENKETGELEPNWSSVPANLRAEVQQAYTKQQEINSLMEEEEIKTSDFFGEALKDTAKRGLDYILNLF